MMMEAKKLPWMYLLAGLLVLSLLGAVLLLESSDQAEQSSSLERPSIVDLPTLEKLATTDTPIDQTHLADHLTPPTNKWFSGFALQADPKPGYNYPNSFLPHTDGFEFSLPKVQAESTIITGEHTPDVVVTIEDAASYKITYYDELVVELTHFSSSEQALATVRIASGLPYVYVSAKQDVAINFSGDSTSEDSLTRISSNNALYGVNVSSSGGRFSLEADEHASFFSAPNDEAFAVVVAHAEAVVESADVSYRKHHGDSFTTTFTYSTLSGEPVLFARLPHQQADDNSEAIYQSVLGDLAAESGLEFSFNTLAVPVTGALDLSGISDEERNLLARQLRSDVTTFEEKPDTYFGGKQLQRMAQLLVIAEQLGEAESAKTARETLKQGLESWLTIGEREPQSFLYDPVMQGIVGNVASFGSDKEFNDHHFHYGYFIYAAAVLAEHDKDFLAAHKNTVNLLVADIANYNRGEKLPLRRSFDPYAGHSWASGTSPFEDGNNQESTSEAINAWVGVSLWARQIENDALELQADWILSQEHHTAQRYWLLQDGATPEYLEDYDSPLASIVWGGKREYATFFSDEPNAKLAIQLLPLSPTIKQLEEPLPEELFRGTSTNQTYGDYILMARPESTLEDAINLPDSAIDDGNSRTYMYAYILAE